MSRRIDYICILELTEDFQKNAEKYNAIIHNHWDFLRNLKNNRILILAGTTLDTSYEIFIIKSNTEEEANEIILQNPMIREKILDFSICPIRSSLVVSEGVEEFLECKEISVQAAYKIENTEQYFGTITGRPTFINDITEEEAQIMGVHFQYLKQRFDNKKLIFAGPILCEGKFGVNIFLSSDYDEALYFVNNDPSVKKKIMEPGLHPFRIFLLG